ncbi:unnamed protein product [Paramecium sonneborni]|uniref:Uncharacterized protein n=1 Tax=Paramecium sonneborni TaxID=65129 RepID=A0A8S1LR98_9CILI|nr:unnamed protein product [Paramecium sonneborni]
MRPQSPKFFQTQTIATTRVVNSPPRDKRHDSCGRLAKVTTYQSRPKATVTTTTYRPVIETRTVKLCTEKKCSGHETLIEQLTQENNKLNQKLIDLQNDLDGQIEKYENKYQTWVNTSIEIENMKKLSEETQKNHKQEVSYLNSELSTFKSQFQYQDDQIRFLTSQLKQQEVLENKIALLTTEIERLQYVIEDKNQLISQQTFRIQDYEKQLQLGQNVIEERNNNISDLQAKSNHYQQDLFFSNNIINELKSEINQKDLQTQQLLAQKDSLIQNYRDNLELLENKLAQSQQNEQLNQEKTNLFSKQMDNLNNKINQLENELNDQREQNFQLNQQVIINDQANEILQSQLLQQTQDHLNLVSNKDSEHEIKNKEITSLLNQLQKKQEELEEKSEDIRDLNNKNQVLIVSLNEKTNQLDLLFEELQTAKTNQENYHEQIKNYHLKLSQEEILNVELKNDLNLQKESLQQSEQQLELQNELNRSLQNQICQLQQQNTGFENKNNQLENEVQSQQIEAGKQQQQLNEQLKQLKIEQENLLLKNQNFESMLSDLKQNSQEQITKLSSQIKNHVLFEDSIKQDKLKLLEQILLQCFELERLKDQNNQQQEQLKSQEDKLNQHEKNKQKQEEDIEKLKESNLQNSQNYDIKSKLLQEQLDENIKQIDSLKNDLKYQLSLEQELNKKNHFQQDKISHLQDVEQQLKYLNEQTNLQTKNLQKELENKIESESSLRFKLEKLLEELKIKQLQLVEMDSQMRLIEQNNNIDLSNLEERISYLQNEVETWKQKFSILNKDYHRVQEDLMMIQAEFDAYKRRGLDLKIKESNYFEVRKSSLYKENIDVKGSQTSISRLFKENI